MKKNLKERYIDKANDLMGRLLWEQEDEEDVVDTEEVPSEEEQPEEMDQEEEPSEEESVVDQVEVFFADLDEKSQKAMMDSLKEKLNVSEDDDYAEQRIVDALSKEPLISFRAEDIVRKLNIDI